MANPNTITIEYDDKAVRYFLIAAIAWSLVSMGIGLLAAFQLYWWQLNIEWLTFARIRPIHTNGAIFAFVGNMIFAGVYYSTQRLCKVRLASKFLTSLHFWSWQLAILVGAITLMMGYTQSKEYAELIWPLDIVVVMSWLAFAGNFFWTLGKRNESSLYVAIWFYIATIVTVAMLYVVNNLQIPTSLVHSYPIFGGVKDALVQWWYGHNAVAFFLTTPILGIMYYYVPKAANRPVYSYRLSVIHFWSLVFIYIWAGPHHLLNSALPEWLQVSAMLFSLMLWAPSWGGMLNGLLTLRTGWQELIKDPIIKFFAAGITFYGMATFEGPLLSIKSVNALSHFTDWTIGHVHSGTLGWNGFMAAGMFYWLAPRLWNTQLYSRGLANLHFWLGMVGVLLYVAAMWVAGITQGTMLNATTEDGVLKYQFIETLQQIMPLYLFRAIGGTVYLLGFLLMTWNIWKTARSGEAVNGVVEVVPLRDKVTLGFSGSILNAPTLYTGAIILFSCVWMFAGGVFQLLGMLALILTLLLAVASFQQTGRSWQAWYDKLQQNVPGFTALTLIAVAIGGAIQIIPTVTVQKGENIEGRIQTVYTPLEQMGRDIYVSEGCYNCHSQQIRMMVPEVLRYGNGEKDNYSHLGESIYNYPFQWGSKRTGPDLAREGGLRGDDWHYLHFMNPRDTSEGSNMPNYAFLKEQQANWEAMPNRIDVLRKLGVPFPDRQKKETFQHMRRQANSIVNGLANKGHEDIPPQSRLVALIAYIQSLGSYEEKGVPSEGTQTAQNTQSE